MKTGITLTFLLITIAMLGQDKAFIASKAYRIQHVTNIEFGNKDTNDLTDFFTEGDGFIILAHYTFGDFITIDRGTFESILFKAEIKNAAILEVKDTLSFSVDTMTKGVETPEPATITKIYIKNSFEETREKIYSFRIEFPNEVWEFITTEIITGKKDI